MNLNLLEVIHKTLDSIDYQYSRGGLHRLAIIAICGLIVYAIICSAELLGRREK